MISDLALVRLLQLASPTLPVGAYSYSQGLEAAIEAGSVTDAASAALWIGDVLRHSIAAVEGPIVLALHRAWRRDAAEPDAAEPDSAAVADEVAALNALFLATRETSELHAETAQMGYSLVRLLGELEGPEAAAALSRPARPPAAPLSFPAAFTFAAARWQIDEEPALLAYLWAALENQVMAAVKAIPLGQTDGQRVLRSLGAQLPALARIAATARPPLDALYNFTPGLAIASSRHEAQYSRLFRS